MKKEELRLLDLSELHTPVRPIILHLDVMNERMYQRGDNRLKGKIEKIEKKQYQ